MLKKFINGLLFGAGFAIAFIAVVWGYFHFINIKNQGSVEEVVLEAPPVTERPERFYGSSAVFSGSFVEDRNKILSSGDAIIVGSVLGEGKPIQGVKLRLGLNGAVMSQWATTDINGRYHISVPAGEYQIDGYELDYDSANIVMSGLIDSPRNHTSNDLVSASSDKEGKGLNLSYVRPVVKSVATNTLVLDQNADISWEKYPEAYSYEVQFYEKTNPDSYRSKHIFPASLKTNENHLNIGQYTDKFQEGRYYLFDVIALDENGMAISASYRNFTSYDFIIIPNSD
ncbi:carboxypeptidase-like regulatory domain-containing protein [Alteromonas ponticola]|uniref:Carboxypeptidase-like regulatory domain-containing protein n=1 Tax=Alteromonas aquimaris TaxID=2998417 RepID=A0ABT3P750_9ALTE|nr:carboxypeptidase-like regulatory domain-containing protein [Alteromonas aquimaris]MCW8108592.1 carboxypeptidase-like regulatory domain-containing protein [Alteromonas aquimaris]